MANAQQSRPATSNEEVDIEIDDTQNLRQLSETGEGHQPPILVLSRDANLVETVRKASPRGTPVAHSPDLDHVAEKLSSLKPGVLVADTASTADVAAMVAQLTQHFPELVVVVAGKKEDSGGLMQLTAAGRIFRFLLTPLSHGQTRLALEAAVTHHVDLKAQGQRLGTGASGEGGGKNYLVTYGALAAGLLVVIGGIWFGVSQFTSEPPAPAPAQTAAPAQPGIAEKPDPIQAELALAKEAFDQRKFIEPLGESALDLYRSALALDPNSEAAKAGIRSVTDQILLQADEALTSEKLEEAVRRIEIARSIEPNHPRLSFYDTQIARERERLKLSQAQEVSNRVRTLVAAATDRMQAGKLITPSGSSARDALVEARRLDPTDPQVAQAIRDLSAQLTEEARKALAAGKTDEAQAFVNAARGLGSAGAALAQVERDLAAATRTASVSGASAGSNAGKGRNAGPNVDAMAADIRQRMSEGKLIDPPGDNAKEMVLNLRATAPNRPEVDELSRALTTRLLDISKQAMGAKAFDRAAQLIAGAREVGARYNEAGIAQAERELVAARELNAAETSIVSSASLKRIGKVIAPKLPESAVKKGISGWVEVVFTVRTDGKVDNVEVRNASPADVFNDAAIRAVRQWRFEPVERNGEKVAQRAMVRLRFESQQPQQD